MSRTFWTKLNHDDARLAIDMMDDAEIGRWFRGWLAGAGGKEYPTEKIASWPVEMRTGFRAGCESAEEAARYSQKQRDRVSSRYRGRATEDHGSTTEQSGSEKSTGTLPSNSQQLTSNIQQPKAKSQKRSTKFSAEAEEIYSLYPRKEARADAIKAIEKALRKTSAEVLADAVRAFGEAVKGQEVRFIPHPATWFNGERWTDDRTTWTAWKANAQPPAATNLPEWKREKIAQLEREATRFERNGMHQSAKDVRREIDSLTK